MKNKSIKIKMLLAGGFLALCLSIGIASNEQIRSILTDTLFGAAVDTYQTKEQKAQEWNSSGEAGERSVPTVTKEKTEGEGKTSNSTGDRSGLSAEEYIAYLAEQQNQASATSRGGSFRADVQNRDANAQHSDQSEFSILKNRNAASQADSETTELAPFVAAAQDDNKTKNDNNLKGDNQSKDLDDASDSANSSGTNSSGANTSGSAAVTEADASSKGESGKENQAVLDQELDLLARLITAEAQGEPYEAQVAVGAVVLNRVKSGVWPDSVREVIYHNVGGYYQFTPVVNGWIDKPAQASCIKAAKAALSGEDPTKGAQFYYDDSTTNEWILSKTVSIKIGHMIFAF
ncbi:MAG: hypothetical protein K0R19_916 [Bacillota bacterium]|jgi:spore germination cell wall hydrolase CwlJ-like protein|nr:hypothetical protein [Bacillota bacterium]